MNHKIRIFSSFSFVLALMLGCSSTTNAPPSEGRCTYSGYGHYDSDELMDGVGEMGQTKNPADYGAARKRLINAATPDQETALKAARNYGGKLYTPNLALPTGLAHQHFEAHRDLSW